MRKSTVILSSIVAILVLVGVIIAGYQLNWWLRGQEVNRSAQINNDSYNRQTSLVSVILDDITEAEGNIPPAQRKAIVDLICDNAAQLTPEFRDQIGHNANLFLITECNL